MWPLIITLVSSVLAGWSSYEQGKKQDEQAQQNAKQLEFDRVTEDEENREATRRQRIRDKRQTGALRVQIAKAGYAMEGTPLAVFGENMANQQLALADMKRESGVTRFRYGQKAQQQIYAGQMAYRSGMYKAGASLLNGANYIASRNA